MILLKVGFAGKIRNIRQALMVIVISGFVFTTPFLSAQSQTFSLDEAIQAALANDPGILSANWDWLSAQAKADAAYFRMFPSLSLSASYQHLSELPPASMEMANPFPPPSTISFEFPKSLTNIYTFSVNLQYPVFAGFRMRETAAIATLQADSKQLALEMLKRSLVFEVRRAYWECVRASANVRTLEKNLELLKTSYTLMSNQAAIGTATKSDVLTADMRVKQAEIDLGQAVSLQKKAYLTLLMLIGKNNASLKLTGDSPDSIGIFILSTQPDEDTQPSFSEDFKEKTLIELALSRRPETRASVISLETGERSVRLAAAGLYPTVTLTGNYTLADPNQRMAFQTDPWLFTGTWSLGITISYDLGGIPANLKETQAQADNLGKIKADSEKQKNSVMLDVQTCILNFERSRMDLSLVKGMVDQAKENLRVAEERFKSGSANNLDLLSAQLALLRANFAVTNKEIDMKIASADLARAVALEEIR
jgi:outer membrane protein